MNNENISRFDRLENWLTNRFWYYYKWYYLLGVFALTVLVLWIYSAATKVDYDWNIVYAHMGQSDSETADKVKKLFLENATDITGNGKIEINLYEICHTRESEERGEHEFYGALYGHQYYLMMVDSDIFELYGSLGYFDDIEIDGTKQKGVYIDSLNLYAVVNKGPALQYTLAQAEERNVSEENLKLINEELYNEHESLAGQAVEILKSLK